MIGGYTILFFFFFNDTATTEIYTLSLHDALPICAAWAVGFSERRGTGRRRAHRWCARRRSARDPGERGAGRSEEHTSELQSLAYLVCRLLLEKKKKEYQPANSVLSHFRTQ